MENSYGTVRVKNIRTAAGMLKMTIDLVDVELNGNVELEIRERLEAEEGIDDVESFTWEIVEDGAEEANMINDIRKVLAKYFEEHSNGAPSETYDSYFSAQDAIDEIVDIIGEY